MEELSNACKANQSIISIFRLWSRQRSQLKACYCCKGQHQTCGKLRCATAFNKSLAKSLKRKYFFFFPTEKAFSVSLCFFNAKCHQVLIKLLLLWHQHQPLYKNLVSSSFFFSSDKCLFVFLFCRSCFLLLSQLRGH